MKKFRFLLLFCFTAGIATAQNGSFLLYRFKGNVTLIEKKGESKAKVGQVLDNTASIKITNGSVATLICNEAAMFTITKGGTYKLSQFGDSCKVSSSSVSANYVKYVWAQMTKSSGSPGSNRKAYMNTVGAVSRSINNVWIDPRLDTVNYSGGEFPLSWKSYAEAKEFTFSLFNSDNISQPFFTKNVSKLKIPIKDFINKLKVGETYYWTAAVKEEENDELKVFNYVSKESFDAFCNSIKKQGAPFETEAEQAYRTAFMLEDAHFLSEAYQYYSKAASLENNNVLYRSTLMSFKKDYEIK